jgi:hypothetical protein
MRIVGAEVERLTALNSHGVVTKADADAIVAAAIDEKFAAAQPQLSSAVTAGVSAIMKNDVLVETEAAVARELSKFEASNRGVVGATTPALDAEAVKKIFAEENER